MAVARHRPFPGDVSPERHPAARCRSPSTTVIDVPDIEHEQRERGRLRAIGKRTDNGSRATLLLVHESDRSWTFHGLGAPGVRLSEADIVALAASIVKRANQEGR